MRIRIEKVICVSDWDKAVSDAYKRPYSFQQQDGCKSRGLHKFTVPGEADDFIRSEVPEVVNGPVMGVNFTAWLERDPKAPVRGSVGYDIGLFWDRNFYPDFQTVANDLHSKGLLDAGDYTIDIDW